VIWRLPNQSKRFDLASAGLLVCHYHSKKKGEQEMRKTIIIIAIILFNLQLFGNELSQPDPEVTRKITAAIQYSSSYRFGDDLKQGDEVVYEVDGVRDDPVFGVHKLKVITKNETTTTILEEFEGNKLFLEYHSATKRVIKIWGYDIEGGEHNLKLLSDNVVKQVLGVNERSEDEFQKFIEWDYKDVNNQITVNGKTINCKSLKPKIKENGLPKNIQDALLELQDLEKIVLSDEIPKLLPLVPVAVPNLAKRDLLSGDNAGFVNNKLLKLKSYNNTKEH